MRINTNTSDGIYFEISSLILRIQFNSKASPVAQIQSSEKKITDPPPFQEQEIARTLANQHCQTLRQSKFPKVSCCFGGGTEYSTVIRPHCTSLIRIPLPLTPDQRLIPSTVTTVPDEPVGSAI